MLALAPRLKDSVAVVLVAESEGAAVPESEHREARLCRAGPPQPEGGGPAGGAKPPPRSELRRHGHERHLVVRLAEAAREGADEGPEEVVGKIAVDEEEVLEVLLADDEQATRLVGARVGAAREVVDERHLAEVRAGAQDGQRLLA